MRILCVVVQGGRGVIGLVDSREIADGRAPVFRPQAHDFRLLPHQATFALSTTVRAVVTSFATADSQAESWP
ncbi:hypothetical protein, partial [Streptomyces sp. CC219B]|uniref:hypothetical protein n=1 Tax=Streptomyces sp. CC219B TaxID=3044574 RepID=UPI0024A881CE